MGISAPEFKAFLRAEADREATLERFSPAEYREWQRDESLRRLAAGWGDPHTLARYLADVLPHQGSRESLELASPEESARLLAIFRQTPWDDPLAVAERLVDLLRNHGTQAEEEDQGRQRKR